MLARLATTSDIPINDSPIASQIDQLSDEVTYFAIELQVPVTSSNSEGVSETPDLELAMSKFSIISYLQGDIAQALRVLRQVDRGRWRQSLLLQRTFDLDFGAFWRPLVP